MLKIIDILVSPYVADKKGDIIRIILIDLCTIGIGFVILIHSFYQSGYRGGDDADVGAGLFILGLLIHYWRKHYKPR